MRIVQALHWLKDTLPSNRDQIQAKLAALPATRSTGRHCATIFDKD
jgi:hypothetical protein